MSELRKLACTAVGLIAMSATPALAADLPAKVYTKAPVAVAPIYNWSGFYIGLNGGGGSSHNCWTLNNIAGAVALPSASEGCHDATGGLAGGQIGYRWQTSNWVFGVEAQGDWADLKGSNSSLVLAPLLAPLGGGFTNTTKIDAIGLFTGQVGYAWNNVLWYAKGGAAVTHDKYSGSLTTPIAFLPTLNFDGASQTRWGGAVGTGVEIGFAPGWSVAFEYDHLFMGSHNNTFTFNTGLPAPLVGTSRTDNIKQDVDMGTVRVNYTFGGPIVAKY
jgi:outer membrane immunogenic protein